jgi:GNAT superfamily N-acetyltransferase
MILRPLATTDLPAAQRLSAGLNWPHRHEDWALLLALGEGVAVTDPDGTLIGTGMWWPHGPDHATIGMVLVAPNRQGRGIGRRIMTALLDAAAPRALMLNATPAGLPLYAALGFAPAGEIHQYQGSWTGARHCPPGLRPGTAADLPGFTTLDAAAVGAPRPHSVAALLAAGTAMARNDGAGFAIARHFGRGTVIGPVIAPDEAAAIPLVTALAEPGAFTRLDIPATATALSGQLAAHGLARVDTVIAMTRGTWQPAASPHRYALMAQALG